MHSVAEEVRELWQEYENNSTPEAKLVKDFDKVCKLKMLAMHAASYPF